MISVIIPVYNEEKNIGKVLNKIPSIVKEVIVVDDGSTDKTAQLAKKNGAKVIIHKKNFGKGESLRSGASIAKGNILVFIDGDGQHDPTLIPKIVRPIINNEADFVIGNRFSKGYDGTPDHRKVSNRLTKFIMSLIIKNKMEDPLSGYRAIRKEIFNKLNLKKKKYEIEIEMINKALREKCRIKEVPIPIIYKNEKSNMRKRDHLRITFIVFTTIIKSLMGLER